MAIFLFLESPLLENRYLLAAFPASCSALMVGSKEMVHAAPDLDGEGHGAQAWWEAPCTDTKCLGRG